MTGVMVMTPTSPETRIRFQVICSPFLVNVAALTRQFTAPSGHKRARARKKYRRINPNTGTPYWYATAEQLHESYAGKMHAQMNDHGVQGRLACKTLVADKLEFIGCVWLV